MKELIDTVEKKFKKYLEEVDYISYYTEISTIQYSFVNFGMMNSIKICSSETNNDSFFALLMASAPLFQDFLYSNDRISQITNLNYEYNQESKYWYNFIRNLFSHGTLSHEQYDFIDDIYRYDIVDNGSKIWFDMTVNEDSTKDVLLKNHFYIENKKTYTKVFEYEQDNILIIELDMNYFKKFILNELDLFFNRFTLYSDEVKRESEISTEEDSELFAKLLIKMMNETTMEPSKEITKLKSEFNYRTKEFADQTVYDFLFALYILRELDLTSRDKKKIIIQISRRLFCLDTEDCDIYFNNSYKYADFPTTISERIAIFDEEVKFINDSLFTQFYRITRSIEHIRKDSYKNQDIYLICAYIYTHKV